MSEVEKEQKQLFVCISCLNVVIGKTGTICTEILKKKRLKSQDSWIPSHVNSGGVAPTNLIIVMGSEI